MATEKFDKAALSAWTLLSAALGRYIEQRAERERVEQELDATRAARDQYVGLMAGTAGG